MLADYLKVARNLDVQPPYFVFLSFLDVKGARLALPGSRAWYAEDERHTVQEETLMLPEIMVEEHDAPAETTLRPLFDIVWNAFGFSRSFNYDDQGNWIGQRR